MRYFRVCFCIILCIVLVGSMTAFISANSEETVTVYEMYVNNEQVGVTKFAARGLKSYDKAISDLEVQYPDDVSIDSAIHFKEIDANSIALTDEATIAKAIEDAVDITTDSYAIIIDSATVCHVRTLEETEKVMDAIKAPFVQDIEASDNSQLEEVTFKENIQVSKENIAYDLLINEDQALKLLQSSSTDAVKYKILEGDSLWTIANANNMHVNDILSINPELDAENIKPGDTINLTSQTNLLAVITTEIVKYNEDILYSTEVRDDKNLAKGKTKVVQQGVNGKKEITTNVVKENGREIDKKILEEITIQEPVNKIEAKGTKVKPVVVVAEAPHVATTTSSEPTVTDRGSTRGADIISFAKQFLGKPYVYAASGPNSFDCSGFTWFVYKHFGFSISRGSSSQRYDGNAVAKADLAPGDIVLFTSPNSGGSVGHVGIYIGGGDFIHASSGSEMRVKIDTLNSGGYATRYKGARRIL